MGKSIDMCLIHFAHFFAVSAIFSLATLQHYTRGNISFFKIPLDHAAHSTNFYTTLSHRFCAGRCGLLSNHCSNHCLFFCIRPFWQIRRESYHYRIIPPSLNHSDLQSLAFEEQSVPNLCWQALLAALGAKELCDDSNFVLQSLNPPPLPLPSSWSLPAKF